MPTKEKVLSLDPIPQPARRVTVTPRAPRRTDGPMTGRGTFSSGVKRKRPAQEDEFEAESDEERRPEESPLPIRVKKEGSWASIEIKKEDGRKNKPKMQPPHITHVIGIDNGMSGSGMSSAPINHDPTRVVAETNWPMGEGMSQKVPSTVALYEDNSNHDDFADHMDNFFGFEIPEGALSRSFYKISMDVDARASKFDDPVLKNEVSLRLLSGADTEKNKRAMIFAMQRLREIQTQKVRDSLGEDALDDIKHVYVFTYPAACSLRGIQALRDAAEEAGFQDRRFDKTEFISEAHAAIMAAFVGCKVQHGSQAWNTFFKQGNLVTILDLGALTNDLTTVRIVQNDPKLQLIEVTIPTGGKCGTAAIHCRILEILERKFGDAFREVPDALLKRGSRFFSASETVLKRFDGTRLDRTIRLPLNLELDDEHGDYDIDAGEVHLRGQDIKDAIDGSLKYAKDLLLEQWNQPKRLNGDQKLAKMPATTVFCGGGSLIPYIFSELKKFCDEHGSRPIRAKDPESTVCRGAVISQLSQDLFGRRLSRASFGILVKQGGHQSIHWFISQGDIMDTSEEVVLKALGGHVSLTLDEVLNEAQDFEFKIFMYTGGGANPEQPTDAGVEQISSIKVDPTTISTHLRNRLSKQLRDAGTGEARLTMTISVSIDRSARITFNAKHERCWMGKGVLRIDATETASGL